MPPAAAPAAARGSPAVAGQQPEGPEGAGAALRHWLASLPAGSVYAAAGLLWAVSFRWSGYDQMYFIATVFALLLGPGLGRAGAGEFSAYSIFNRGQRHLLGELRAEQLDAEQRGDQYLAGYAGPGGAGGGGLIDLPGPPGAGGAAGGAAGEDEDGEAPLIRSRDANRPCPCGSGRKAKRCCFAPKARGTGAEGAAGGSAGAGQAAPEPDPLLDQWRAEMEVVASGRGGGRGGAR